MLGTPCSLKVKSLNDGNDNDGDVGDNEEDDGDDHDEDDGDDDDDDGNNEDEDDEEEKIIEYNKNKIGYIYKTCPFKDFTPIMLLKIVNQLQKTKARIDEHILMINLENEKRKKMKNNKQRNIQI